MCGMTARQEEDLVIRLGGETSDQHKNSYWNEMERLVKNPHKMRNNVSRKLPKGPVLHSIISIYSFTYLFLYPRIENPY